MFDLKPLSKEAIPAALEKAMRYRLLNEPGEAESACHDILRADPENHDALITLFLALTDRFGKGYGVGVLQAATQEESAHVLTNGVSTRQPVEPLSRPSMR